MLIRCAFVSTFVFGLVQDLGSAQCPTFSPEFASDGTIRTARRLAVYDGGSGSELYAADGQMIAAGRQVANGIARWNGASWSSVGTGISGPSGFTFEGLCVHDDGSGPQLYVGGSIDHAGGVSVSSIARWNGASWSAVGTGVPPGIWSLCSTDLGSGPRLFAGRYGYNSIAAMQWDGASWSDFGAVVTAGRVQAMAGWNGELFIAGSDNGKLFRGTGGAWTNANSGISGAIGVLEVLDDGSGPKLYAGGFANCYEWNGASWTAIGSLPDLDVRGLAVVDTGGGPALHAVGYDSLITPVNPPIEVVRRWNGSSWTRVGGAHFTSGGALAIASYDDGSGAATYVAGTFGSLQGDTAQSVARWDGTHWRPLGSSTGLSGAQFGPDVRAFAGYTPPGAARPWVVAGGRFAKAGDADARNVAAWTGTEWNTLAGGVGGEPDTVYGLCAYDEPNAAPPVLFAAGTFLPSTGSNMAGVARFDGTSWTKVGNSGAGGVGGTARALIVHDDGSGAGSCLFVGGSFALVDGNIPAMNVARWNGATWQALGTGLNSGVFGFALYDDPQIAGGAQLYAVGQFSASGATPMARVARWNGTAWSSVGFPGTVTQTVAIAWNAGSGNELFVGGLADSYVRRWNGNAWTNLSANYLGVPVTVFDDGFGEQLYLNSLRWDGSQFTSFPGGANAAGAVIDEGNGSRAYWIGAWGVMNSTIFGGVGRYSNPCAVLATYCTASTNSQGCTPVLSWTGSPSASSAAAFTITASPVINQKSGLFFYGLSGRNALPFHGGTLCIKAPTRRTAVQTSGGNVGPDDCSGAYAFDFNAWTLSGSDTALFGGVRVDGQYWSRDPASPFGVALTGGIEFEILP